MKTKLLLLLLMLSSISAFAIEGEGTIIYGRSTEAVGCWIGPTIDGEMAEQDMLRKAKDFCPNSEALQISPTAISEGSMRFYKGKCIYSFIAQAQFLCSESSPKCEDCYGLPVMTPYCRTVCHCSSAFCGSW